VNSVSHVWSRSPSTFMTYSISFSGYSNLFPFCDIIFSAYSCDSLFSDFSMGFLTDDVVYPLLRPLPLCPPVPVFVLRSFIQQFKKTPPRDADLTPLTHIIQTLDLSALFRLNETWPSSFSPIPPFLTRNPSTSSLCFHFSLTFC